VTSHIKFKIPKLSKTQSRSACDQTDIKLDPGCQAVISYTRPRCRQQLHLVVSCWAYFSSLRVIDDVRRHWTTSNWRPQLMRWRLEASDWFCLQV